MKRSPEVGTYESPTMNEPAKRIPGTSVQIVDEPVYGHVRHAVFDYDGTVSYMRDGWQDFMVPLMIEVLEACPRHESREELERLVIDFVDHLTGKQTIYQMIRLAEEVQKRGGTARDPLEYKNEYYARLNTEVEQRYADVRSGARQREEFIVEGAEDFLQEARKRGVRCYLATGTDEEYVKDETRVVRLDHYFDGGIFGALANYTEFSKEKVIRKILSDFDLQGPELLIVGDGYVEILNGRSVGAVCLGVHTSEKNKYHMNEDKRDRLLRAGAHLMAPDLRNGDAILNYLCGT